MCRTLNLSGTLLYPCSADVFGLMFAWSSGNPFRELSVHFHPYAQIYI